MRTFGATLWREEDGSIKTCHLEVYEDGEKKETQGRILLANLSKRELDNLFWALEDARKDMVYDEREINPPFGGSHLKIKRKEKGISTIR